MQKRRYEEGQQFGRLTITAAYIEQRNGRWRHGVVCECGNRKDVDGGDLGSGGVSSCGCIRFRHSMTHSSEYKVWAGILQRCKNKKNAAYKNYGGRGINVCERWEKFDNFIEDMGVKPSASLTLERVDNDSGYNKDNCVWADRFDQAVNQRVRKDNKTGCRGVSFDHVGNRYVANITRGKVRTHIGSFNDIGSAISARKLAEKQMGNK